MMLNIDLVDKVMMSCAKRNRTLTIDLVYTIINEMNVGKVTDYNYTVNLVDKHFPDGVEILREIKRFEAHSTLEENKLKYIEVNGNLINLAKLDKFDVIAHGCNCFCSMSGGIAAALAKEFNCDKFDWEKPIFKGNYNKLGLINSGYIEKYKFTLVNCYTQYDGGANLDYEALTLCLKKINKVYSGLRIGLPQIGCGIGGGDWYVVRQIILKTLIDCYTTVVIYE